ncbi:SPW repeat-containing protein [Haloactinospora alba]|uniref:SPW repeat-containing protein n=1 Tax=Haloactinospora alba TaxID=405555 RepID=A0A543NF86_9ACTN|nr:SPW repeat protein [Haloactinospora alba]TQN30481.1 SPW repeat-containing protein [Haloactinospora alba]
MRGHWQDWVAVAAGTAAVVSWSWHGMVGPAMAALFVLGVLTVFSGFLSVTHSGVFATEAAMVGLGVLMFLIPWLLDFTANPAAAWTSWVLGAAIALAGVARAVAAGIPTPHRAVPH